MKFAGVLFTAILPLIATQGVAASWLAASSCLVSFPAAADSPEFSMVATAMSVPSGQHAYSLQLRIKTPDTLLPDMSTADGVTVEIPGHGIYDGLKASGS